MTATYVQHRFRPRGVVRKAFADRGREVVLSGPAGTGKSRGALEKVHAMALRNPGMRALLLRKTAASLTSTGLVTWTQQVVPEALLTGAVVWYGGSAQEPAQYRYDNGSRVVVGGLDRATKVMSSEYDLAYVQEATELTEDDWEMVGTRLRNGVVSFQQLLADTNPDRPTHWLKRRADQGKTVMYDSRHTDNPVLYHEDGTQTERGKAYMATLDALTGVRRLRLRDGIWAAADGLVYESWDPAIHLVDRPSEPPHEWPRYWVIDFGYTNPFVCQWWAEDPDGRLFMYREIYQTQTLVEDHAKEMLRLVTRADGTWKEPKPVKIICDHDAEDRATLTKHLGMPTVAAKKGVETGIQAVETRLRDGRMFLLRNALVRRDSRLDDAKKPACTAEEFPGYVWPKSSAGTSEKEAPVKENDHGADCARYLCADRDLRKEFRVRWAG